MRRAASCNVSTILARPLAHPCRPQRRKIVGVERAAKRRDVELGEHAEDAAGRARQREHDVRRLPGVRRARLVEHLGHALRLAQIAGDVPNPLRRAVDAVCKSKFNS